MLNMIEMEGTGEDRKTRGGRAKVKENNWPDSSLLFNVLTIFVVFIKSI